MKNTFLLLAVLFFLTGCIDRNKTHQETVTSYYKAFHNGNYNQVKSLINDNITLVAGDYVTPHTKESFYEHFKWDSIFQPTYKIIYIESQNDQVIATIESSSPRYQFLKNNPLTYSYKISFAKGKISKLEDLNTGDTDWNLWAEQRENLVNWVETNHPELDGFMEDLTMQGAIDYLKAIELYENRKSAP